MYAPHEQTHIHTAYVEYVSHIYMYIFTNKQVFHIFLLSPFAGNLHRF
jgi:hypothetical protein